MPGADNKTDKDPFAGSSMMNSTNKAGMFIMSEPP